jgi:serine/threonine protein phosphatase 1
MPRRIFIGDIHGHYDGLKRLWDYLDPRQDDQIYCIGDLIDRGPKSAEVVEFVRQHATGCVRGNHEQLLLEAFSEGELNLPNLQGWIFSGGQATLTSYDGSTEALGEHVEWLKLLPLYIDLGDVFLVHAGVNPALPIAEQSTHDLCWIRESFHSSTTPFFADKMIISGHTMTFTFPGVQPGQVVEGQGWLDIDTGVYHPRSGWLTAIDWDNRLVYQVNVFGPECRVRPYKQAVTAISPKAVKQRRKAFMTRALTG